LKTGFPKIENLVPRIREIGSLQVQTGYRIFPLKKSVMCEEYKHTQSAKCRLVKTDTTEQFIANSEVEQQTLS